MGNRIETPFDAQATNIAAALKLAQATFPEDAARRIVLVTDGNQNQGNAVEQAQAVAAAGIGVDIVPVRYHCRAEVAVERVILPATSAATSRSTSAWCSRTIATSRPSWNGNVPGKLTITKIVDDQPVGEPMEEHIVLPPGKSVFNVRQTIDSANFYTYEAKFVPEKPGRRRHAAEQPRDRFHARRRQGAGAVDRQQRAGQGAPARPARRAAAAAGAGGGHPRHRPPLLQPGRPANLRHRSCWPTCRARPATK